MGVRVPIHSIGSTLLLCLFLSFSHGLFTQTTCWGSECVQRKETGAWCYVPKSGETALLDCKGSQTDLQSVMNVHLAQDLSIAYYSGVDNSRFGGASWPVPANAGVVRLCASGYAGDGTLQTLCVNVNADNSISGSPYCEIADGPHVVSDGCYTYQPTFTSVIQTTTNPPPPSSTNSPPTGSPPSFSTSKSSSSSSSSSTRSSQTTSSSSPSSTETSSNPNSSSIPSNNFITIGVPIIVAVIGAFAVIVVAIIGKCSWDRRSRNRAVQQQQADQQPMLQPGHQQPTQQPGHRQPIRQPKRQDQYPPPQQPAFYGVVR